MSFRSPDRLLLTLSRWPFVIEDCLGIVLPAGLAPGEEGLGFDLACAGDSFEAFEA